MLKKGDYLKTKTKTQDDVFGTCIYRVDEVGLQAPEKERRAAGVKDGVKCVMLGGSGPAARSGMTVMDSDHAIRMNVKAGITEIIPEAKALVLAGQFQKAKSSKPPSGVREVNW
jgi:hypothetical protein